MIEHPARQGGFRALLNPLVNQCSNFALQVCGVIQSSKLKTLQRGSQAARKYSSGGTIREIDMAESPVSRTGWKKPVPRFATSVDYWFGTNHVYYYFSRPRIWKMDCAESRRGHSHNGDEGRRHVKPAGSRRRKIPT